MPNVSPDEKKRIEAVRSVLREAIRALDIAVSESDPTEHNRQLNEAEHLIDSAKELHAKIEGMEE